MRSLLVLFASLLLEVLGSALLGSRADTPAAGYFNPLEKGGAMLTTIIDDPGVGEPLNVIISGNSDPAVMIDSTDNGGLRNFFLSMDFAHECLDEHLGNPFAANLGDGNGPVNQTAEIRYDYGSPTTGTCEETLEGGDHFRYYRQNGSQANSGAYFLAVSYELPLTQSHNVIFDGYNVGRDLLVGNLTNTTISNPTNKTTFNGTSSFNGYTYRTSGSYQSGLLNATNNGVNHAATVGGGPKNITAIDGLVAVLNVQIIQRPGSNADSSNSAFLTIPALSIATLIAGAAAVVIL